MRRVQTTSEKLRLKEVNILGLGLGYNASFLNGIFILRSDGSELKFPSLDLVEMHVKQLVSDDARIQNLNVLLKMFDVHGVCQAHSATEFVWIKNFANRTTTSTLEELEKLVTEKIRARQAEIEAESDG